MINIKEYCIQYIS